MADEKLVERFTELVAKPVDDQAEFFLKSFIFALDSNWKEIPRLSKVYKDYLKQTGEDREDLNAAQAADFLQKNGKTRTAIERREEIADIDLDNNDRIAFTEYLLLHFKVMILKEYYKRHQKSPEEDLSRDGIGTCVG